MAASVYSATSAEQQRDKPDDEQSDGYVEQPLDDEAKSEDDDDEDQKDYPEQHEITSLGSTV
jgi:hypothetical protein